MPNKSAHGFTLIEVILVVVIIGVVFTPLLLTYSAYRNTQALYNSAEAVANHTTSAHIFARDAKNQRNWGIKNIDSRRYSIYSSGDSGELNEYNYSLEPGVSFGHDFEILFEIGSGETSHDFQIKLENESKKKLNINVSKLGIAEVEVM